MAPERVQLVEKVRILQLDLSNRSWRYEGLEVNDRVKLSLPRKRLRLIVKPQYSRGLRDAGIVVVGI